MDKFPPAEDGPQYELASIGRTMEDLSPDEHVAPRPGGILVPLLWTALALIALMAFIGVLLVG
jgi:hypothetical protein